jgi:hypothetical protein
LRFRHFSLGARWLRFLLQRGLDWCFGHSLRSDILHRYRRYHLGAERRTPASPCGRFRLRLAAWVGLLASATATSISRRLSHLGLFVGRGRWRFARIRVHHGCRNGIGLDDFRIQLARILRRALALAAAFATI